ncbi:alpha/beta fold hydrolase [Streptomyces meridianus]|uniref:Alpha/beta hydrolase n=1 Tax=Streptomyces meridianus TaxID=2938945 RepID=A0ABT0XC50_9ACTN|nr:alpha/beta hydrolase [Streptomyces meridianus]MCM2579379.1 alpha/beta hydrolase [Streptomyces meridianus]
MPTFTAPDGTELAYHVSGDGAPVVCLPGGPMRDSAYLGDLGGLSAHRQLIRLDLRGTGRSAVPADPGSYRCDRLVGDLEALREHLGLDRMDLLAHSAGASLAALYAGRHPERIGRLALITPSVNAVGIAVTDEDRLGAARPRREEPWFPTAFTVLEEIVAGSGTDGSWRAITPFLHGRWDEAAQSLQASEDEQTNTEAAAVYNDGAFDPDATRRALAAFGQPVLLLAGDLDLATPPRPMEEFAALFPDAEFVVLPGSGHYPWLDDADRFVAATARFLDRLMS